ncbi:DNA-binding transcriptional response regulator [Glycomyces albidus]|jgi:CheY-like chemotaxis protein|nr:hypothetical protein [Glycomyces albidus]
MSEAIWIELIKVLPAFLWIGFGFIALAVAKRIFTQQAPRMTKVETPWVTVELAQQAIEEASHRSPQPPLPDWNAAFQAPPPVQQPAYGVPSQFGSAPGSAQPYGVAPGGPQPYRAAPGGAAPYGVAAPGGRQAGTDTGASARVAPPKQVLDTADEADETSEEPVQTEPAPLRPPNTPPADEPATGANANGAKPNDDPAGPLTEPRPANPDIPAYQFAPPPTTYYAPPLPNNQSAYPGSVPLPPYQQPPAYTSADAQRGLRAATRLALSADLLNGGAILWVDDHPEGNESLIRLFRTAGITVDAVVSTARAVLALKEKPYDLVITDMRRGSEADGATAGIVLLDRMVEAGVPTPGIIYSSDLGAIPSVHPRAAKVTDSPEELVDAVVDFVGTRRSRLAQNQGGTWLDRLRGD